MFNKWQIEARSAEEAQNPGLMRRRRTILVGSFLAAIFFMGLLDFASTMLAVERLGGFEYESSIVIKLIYASYGLPGFLIVKMTVVSLIAFIVYRERLIYMLWAMSLGGLIVSISNLYVFAHGYSIQVGGVEAVHMAGGILAVGMLLSILCLDSVKGELEKLRCKLTRSS